VKYIATETLNIGTEDGGELSLDVFCGHSITLPAIKKPPNGHRYPPEAQYFPPSGDMKP